MTHIEQINKHYYDKLYKHKHPLLHLIHARVSFDQQSKSRPNHTIANPIIKKICQDQKEVRILDYGSSWGVFLLQLPKISAIKAYCYDLSTNTVLSLQRAMKFLGRDVQSISVDENGHISPDKFDLIVCSHVLEHVEDDEMLLQQFAKVLKTGGYLLINVPINEVWRDPKHLHRYNPSLLAEKMTKAGFKIHSQWEGSKWNGLLRLLEIKYEHRFVIRLIIRIFRGTLALSPYSLVRSSEMLLTHYDYQYLIMVGVK